MAHPIHVSNVQVTTEKKKEKTSKDKKPKEAKKEE